MRSFHRITVVLAFKVLLIATACIVFSPQGSDVSSQGANVAPQGWQEEFNLSDRKLSDTGEAKYFILTPGFQLTLASQSAQLIITVLDETKVINGITTRVIEEREEISGNLYEISRNFYAIDPETGDAFYFGEEVDFYENGEIVGHKGEWLAYEKENRPGLIIPGVPEVGMKYYQELAPGAAMDRAEVISVSETFSTPAGEFENCLRTEESSKIEPVIEHKTYCPGIGLVQDQSLLLVRYGVQE
jgi:hypothetical protein